jgi:hypothetical protein
MTLENEEEKEKMEANGIGVVENEVTINYEIIKIIEKKRERK